MDRQGLAAQQQADRVSHEFFGKNIRSLDLYNSAALSVIFNREARTEKEGLLMVAGTYDEKQNEILIFQYPQNTLLRARKAAPVPVIRGGCHHKADVSSVSIVPFCSDNPFVVAAGDSQGDITLYRPSIEMQELDQIAQWAPFTASAQCTATKSFVSSNPKLVAGSDDGTACVVDLDAAKPIESLSSLLGCKGDGVRDVDFPSPNCVALACSSGTVRFYDTRQRNNETITLRNASTSSLLGLTSLEVNRDTLQVVATGDAEGNLQVWDLRATGRPLLSAKKHNGPIWQSRWNPKEDMQLISSGEDGSVLMWSFRESDGKHPWSTYQLFRSPMAINCIGVDSTTDLLVGASDQEAIYSYWLSPV